MTIGEFLRTERKRRGLTQKMFAEQLELHSVQISNIENGLKPGVRTIQRILKGLRIEKLPDEVFIN